jgi:hypothetical protein
MFSVMSLDPAMNALGPAEAKAAAKINRQQLTLIWEDRRASDRDERLRLYRVKPQ